MNEPMRPMGLGEILDRTFQMYRRQFLRFFSVGALPSVVLLVFYALTTGYSALLTHLKQAGVSDHTLGDMTFWYFWVAGAVYLMSLVGATALSLAALTEATKATFLGGKFTIRGAYGSAWKRRWPNLWLLTMDVLTVVVIPALAIFGILKLKRFLPTLASRGGSSLPTSVNNIAAFVLIAAVLAVALWLMLRFSLGFAACVAEQVSAWQALKRSGVLSKGTKSRLFVVFFLGNTLDLIFKLGVPYPMVIVTFILPGVGGGRRHEDLLGVVFLWVIMGLWIVVPSLVRPLYGIALTLFYFDQRIRKEGFDIEWMMKGAGMESVEPAGGSGA